MSILSIRVAMVCAGCLVLVGGVCYLSKYLSVERCLEKACLDPDCIVQLIDIWDNAVVRDKMEQCLATEDGKQALFEVFVSEVIWKALLPAVSKYGIPDRLERYQKSLIGMDRGRLWRVSDIGSLTASIEDAAEYRLTVIGELLSALVGMTFVSPRHPDLRFRFMRGHDADLLGLRDFDGNSPKGIVCLVER